MINGTAFETPQEAISELKRLYAQQAGRLVKAYQEAVSGNLPDEAVRACYPEISLHISRPPQITDRTRAYGLCHRRGLYRNTFGRPDILGGYIEEQLEVLLESHAGTDIHVGLSSTPIPLAYALNETVKIEGEIAAEQAESLIQYFDRPEAAHHINGHDDPDFKGSVYPLSWYNGPRTDRALLRLRHYTGTDPVHFQKYILFTNYQDYMDAFASFAQEALTETAEEPWIAFVEPGNKVTLNENVPDARDHFEKIRGGKPKRMPQMPAFHLVREGGLGISIVNIGVGPSNAKTITDELAVLRPEAWMMVGHCAGLSAMQRVGDYVIPNGYVLKDGLMELILGTNIDIPDLSEIHRAIKDAVREELGVEGDAYKETVRTGVITTTANRNWEVPETLEDLRALEREFARNRSIALDMETGTIVANGFKHHVPYGAILCVSDMPMHGVPKLPGMAQDFYKERVLQQFRIAMQAMQNIRKSRDPLHSRKLRSDFEHVPFL